MTDVETPDNVVELATELTIAWLSNPNTRANAGEIPDFLRTMHEAVSGLTNAQGPSNPAVVTTVHQPAVTARKSLASPEHIISLIDGKSYKTLRRHLSTNGLTPEEYRQRYGLKSDYPMVAPAYAERRRELAKKIGLGRKPRQLAEGSQQAALAPKRGRAVKAS